jgi:hypothetical protein
MNDDRQKLLDDSLKAEKAAAKERERIIRDADKEKEDILNHGVLLRAVSVGQQKAIQRRAVDEKLHADLKALDEAEAERKKRVAEQLDSLEKTEAAEDQKAATQTEEPGWFGLLREERRIEQDILDLEDRLKKQREPFDPRWELFDAETLKKLGEAGVKLERGDPERTEKEIRRLKELKELIAKRRAQLEDADNTKPIVWLGNNRDFGDAVFKLYRKKLIQGKDWVDALRILGPHFVDKEGNRFNPENIRESIRVREKKEGKGGPGDGLKLD